MDVDVTKMLIMEKSIENQFFVQIIIMIILIMSYIKCVDTKEDVKRGHHMDLNGEILLSAKHIMSKIGMMRGIRNASVEKSFRHSVYLERNPRAARIAEPIKWKTSWIKNVNVESVVPHSENLERNRRVVKTVELMKWLTLSTKNANAVKYRRLESPEKKRRVAKHVENLEW